MAKVVAKEGAEVVAEEGADVVAEEGAEAEAKAKAEVEAEARTEVSNIDSDENNTAVYKILPAGILASWRNSAVNQHSVKIIGYIKVIFIYFYTCSYG